MTTGTGRCLCGAVTFTVAERPTKTDACHCSFCRKWTGGPLFSFHASDVTFAGDELATYQSSDWAERGFCAKCGSSIFYRTLDGSFLAINTFLLDDLEGLDFEAEIFVDEKPGCYAFAGERRQMTGEEVFAAFAGGAGAE